MCPAEVSTHFIVGGVAAETLQASEERERIMTRACFIFANAQQGGTRQCVRSFDIHPPPRPEFVTTYPDKKT